MRAERLAVIAAIAISCAACDRPGDSVQVVEMEGVKPADDGRWLIFEELVRSQP